MRWSTWKEQAPEQEGTIQGRPLPEAGERWEPEVELVKCSTPGCSVKYLAEPHWEEGYVHKHCCSKCTRTRGYKHTR
eukprot:237581-Heterocapsa_arctica.AAC.1